MLPHAPHLKMVSFVSDLIKELQSAENKVSPYYSGLGVEFSPQGSTSPAVNPILHETGYLPENSKWNFPSVLSPFWRIYYNLDPGHQVFVDDEAHELTPGRLFIIPSQVSMHCYGEHPVRHFWMAFSMPSRWADLRRPLPIKLEPSKEEAVLINEISRLIEEAKAAPAREPVYHRSMALLHLLFARLNILWKPPFPEPFARLLKFVDQNVDKALPNQILAQQAGMSIATLCRTFQSYIHTTPANYISQVRITKAVHLLGQTELSMDAIADRLGFPNRAYFSRVFKKITTMSPGEYRKRKALHRQTTSEQAEREPLGA